MLNIGKFFLIFILFFTSYLFVNASYNYQFNCDDYKCYETKLGALDIKNNYGYFLDNTKIEFVNNFNDSVDKKLDEYIDYYGNSKFLLKGYYDGKTDPYDKNIDLGGLLKLSNFQTAKKNNGKIEVLNSYLSGKDFLLSNFTSVIDILHIGFPIWDKKNKISDILKNIVYYDGIENKYWVKNICIDSECDESNYSKVSLFNNNDFYLLSGNIKPNKLFIVDNFKVSEKISISDYNIKSGESLNFKFGFEDYLDAGSLSTQYKYIVSYGYENEEVKDILNETLNISNDYKITSPNIDAAGINKIVDFEVLNNKSKKISVLINEGFVFTKPGKVTFYLTVENKNTKDLFEKSKVNYAPVVVLPNDNVKSGESVITTPFSKNLNDKGFNINDTFSVNLSLKDEFGNEHYDYIDGYDISLSQGTSNDIELSKVGSNIYSKNLTGIKTTQISPYYIEFKFRITKPGYHILKGFDVKVRNKVSNSVYSIPAKFYNISNIFPSNLYDGEQKMNIYIKSADKSDFNINCSKGPIIIKSKCTSDNFSGCNPSMDQSITFTKESENGSKGALIIQDYAYNMKSYQYVMNHIDQTPPIISIHKGNTELSGTSYNYKANDNDFKISFYESTTSNCDAEINYLVKINDVIIFNSKYSGSSTSIPLNKFLKEMGTKKLYIKATDKYGNSSEKTLNFNIYPSEDLSGGNLSLIGGENTKYANDSDIYKYKLILKDKYGNPIYGKNIDLIDQSCTGYSNCKSIKTNMVDNSGIDALIEEGYGKTNNNGETEFFLKSLTPGEFNQRFKISMNKWDDNYSDLPATFDSYISTPELNSFKKPFIGTLSASKDGSNWGIKPEIGTSLNYKLSVIPKESKVNNIGTTLENFKSYIRPYDSDNTSIEGVSEINGLNTKNPIFEARINTSIAAKTLGIPGVKVEYNGQSPIEILYVLGGKNVKYYLSAEDFGTDKTPILLKDDASVFLGVKVIGSLQGKGKGEITGQNKNFSDLSASEKRIKIRKSAYDYIKNMKSGDILNKVKYVVGDISLSSSPTDYETLVVKDGNVKINGDLISSKLGIIVLKDNYDVKSGYNGKGNVYVYPSVKTINAIIYADGGLISCDNSGNPFTSDSISRTSTLSNQLFMNGTLFTRNTIGGAIFSGGNYILPGGSKISDFNKAMIYDLNYIRRGNTGCDKNTNSNCSDFGEYTDPFIIKYDSKIQSNPPKLFVD